MSRVQTPDEKLAALHKPTLQTVQEFTFEPDDCLIICAGFEDRALAVLQSAAATKSPFGVLVINYLPFVEQNKVAEIRDICNRTSLSIHEVTYDRQNPAGFGTVLGEKISGVHGRLFVDISAMSRLLIVQVLVSVRDRLEGFKNCFVAYAEAAKYPPNRKDTEAAIAKCDLDPTFSVLFLSSGVFEVTVVPELSSAAVATSQTRLIAFPSLDADQITALRAELQPSRFTFIEGIPPSPENKWRKQAISTLNRLDQLSRAERISTSTLNYAETLDCLLDIYAKHGILERLLISPTGSKMQTVAVGLFRAFIDDVQIVYPTPRGFRYPENYTSGIGPLHSLTLDKFAALASTC